MSYKLISKIGSGGMGCVYKAQDSSGRTIAIKMMSNQVTCYPEYRELFQAEVDTLKKMDHPSIVHIVGEPYKDDSGNLYLPMEYVEGMTIEQWVNKNGVFQPEQAVALMCKILEALQYVHNRRRIHRDIKPSNIMIKPDGNICVIDFGIAKDAKIGKTGHTVGRIIGTDGYMSPEQATGLNIDTRTDIYSLGCVLYFLLTGKHAIQNGNNDYETICNITKSVPLMPSQSGTGVSTVLDDVFTKAVNKDMTKRYQTAAEFKDALEAAIGISVPTVTIGRSQDNDIVLNHDDVSRRHLVIRGIEKPLTGGAKQYLLEITDVGSTNGTGLNGRLLKNETTTIDYNGTVNLPEIFIAGRPELSVNWKEVMKLLKNKGWSPTKKAVKPVIIDDDEYEYEFEEGLNIILRILCIAFPIFAIAVYLYYKYYIKTARKKYEQATKYGVIGIILNNILFFIL